MGQTWSDETASAVATTPTSPTGMWPPRTRADSEPPTSWGGHAVSRIPENEEVNVKTSDIQYADWKKASGASGILKDKSLLLLQQQQPPQQPAAAVPRPMPPSSPVAPNDAETTGAVTAAAAGVAIPTIKTDAIPTPPPLPPSFKSKPRSLSVDYTHLADFSMFPDKFSTATSGGGASAARQIPSDKRVTPATPPSTPLSTLATSFFRTRAASTSEADERRQKQEKELAARNGEMFPGNGNNSNKATTSDSLTVPEASFRPRSSSYSGRLPFFDFSMIPDKDPHFDGDREIQGGAGRRSSVASQASSVASQTGSVAGSPPTTDNKAAGKTAQHKPNNSGGGIIAKPDGPSLVAAALTMAATRPEAPKPPSPPSHESPKPVKPAAAAQHGGSSPRFTFFDYSLIPDKDPRAFAPKNGRDN